jgi:small GTP-binding protein
MVIRSRVVFVGDATVGKSSIVKTFCQGPSGFSKSYVMTQACDVLDKPWKVNNRAIEFQIIDTSGQTIFRDISSEMVKPIQISRSFVVVFVYDITNPESFTSLQVWLKTVRDALKDKVFYGFVVANKSDISERILVKPQDGAAFARSNRFEFIETSAVIFN